MIPQTDLLVPEPVRWIQREGRIDGTDQVLLTPVSSGAQRAFGALRIALDHAVGLQCRRGFS